MILNKWERDWLLCVQRDAQVEGSDFLILGNRRRPQTWIHETALCRLLSGASLGHDRASLSATTVRLTLTAL